MKLFAIAATVIILGIVIGGVVRTRVMHHAPTREGASAVDPDGAEIRRLLGVARGHNSGSRNVRVLAQRAAGRDWHLVYSASPRRICWVLFAAGAASDGTCGAPAKIRASDFIAYSGSLAPGRPEESPEAFVVYGRVSSRVKALQVLLSDCSTLDVPLPSRPIYWRFIPTSKLRARIYPIQALGTLADGTTERSLLSQQKRARSTCR